MIELDGLLLPAIATGFCGTFSSFSSFILELFQHSTNQGLSRAAYPNAGYGVMEFISVVLIQLIASGGALVFGMAVMRHLLTNYNINSNKIQRSSKFLAVIARWSCVPIIVSHIVLSIVFTKRAGFWTISSLFGIVGSSVRWELSNVLNNRYKWFPLGTFLSNITSITIASALFLARYGLKNGQLLIKKNESLDMITYLILGFCGGMSTLSTFVYEGYKMNLIHSTIYYIISVGICYIISILIIGIYGWLNGIMPTETLLT